MGIANKNEFDPIKNCMRNDLTVARCVNPPLAGCMPGNMEGVVDVEKIDRAI